MKDRVSSGEFSNFCFQNSYFLPPKMDEFNFKRAQYWINKIFELTKSKYLSDFKMNVIKR